MTVTKEIVQELVQDITALINLQMTDRKSATQAFVERDAAKAERDTAQAKATEIQAKYDALTAQDAPLGDPYLAASVQQALDAAKAALPPAAGADAPDVPVSLTPPPDPVVPVGSDPAGAVTMPGVPNHSLPEAVMVDGSARPVQATDPEATGRSAAI